ncbi:MAG: hypothetical protein ACI4DS_02480 [Eubacterium sp.]
MSTFWEEHGEIVISSIIGITIIGIFIGICLSLWQDFMPEYSMVLSENNTEIIEYVKENSPKICAEDVIYADYKGEFNIRDYVKAYDASGTDISLLIKYDGEVDTYIKGLYELRCYVKADNNLTDEKYIKVIVE